MAFSSSEGKKFFEDWLFHVMAAGHIKKILDIGAGAGAYGEIANKVCRDVQQWVPNIKNEFIIRAVEVYKPFIAQYKLLDKYTSVISQDIREYVKDLDDFDLIILGDVLEHLTKDDAIDLFFKLKSKTKFIWLSIPVRPFYPWQVGYDQGSHEWEVNKYEEHLYYWKYDELITELGPFLTTVQYPVVSVFIARGAL